MPILNEHQELPDELPLDPRLGRLRHFDERSANYPIRTLLGPIQEPVSKEWSCLVRLDQGNVGACVGFSQAADAAADPYVWPADNQLGLSIYYDAQKIDPWPGENYEGTSVLAGAQVARTRGYISEFRWAFGIDDVIDTIGHFGPVVLGINWYEGMFYPDANGIIRPTGRVAGGHAILAVGVDIVKRLVKLHNSWSRGWGIDGACWISFDDLSRLLQEGGEACVPVVRVNPNPPQPDPEPDPGPTPVARFFSSKYGLTFHRLSHKVGTQYKLYTSYQQAIDAGKRPCKVCKPTP